MVTVVTVSTKEKLRFLQLKYRISPTKLYNTALIHVLKTKYNIDPETVSLTELKIDSSK